MISDAEQAVIIQLGNLIPDNHILKKLKTIFNWEELAMPFAKNFKSWKEYGPMDTP